jgi:lipid II:glycine glycyltransferase (peptidoglycan interpeptide bridge formation enzyme)
MFRTDATGPKALLAFAWSHHHGDHAHYDASGSTRNTDIKAPLAYALIWDLCLWAKQHGATWFDFGGITAGSAASGDADPVGGISDFKRYFSKTVVSVGEEWMLEPRPLRAKLARSISRAISYVSGLRS